MKEYRIGCSVVSPTIARVICNDDSVHNNLNCAYNRDSIQREFGREQGDLSLDAGWMWVNYFNALHDGQFAGFGTTKETNFAVVGAATI